MFRKPAVVTAVVTVYLVLYYILFHAGASDNIIISMFIASPFLVIWMVITILKNGHYKGPELKEDEEWGYQDRDKNSLGTF
jgi:hypothetical protein